MVVASVDELKRATARLSWPRDSSRYHPHVKNITRLLWAFAVVLLLASVPSSATADANMKARVPLLFRLGFAGKLSVDALGLPRASVDADTSPGIDFRVDVPVFRFITLGPVISIYAVRPVFPRLDRNPIVDISAFLKGRYPFLLGRKKGELYGMFQGGFSMVFLRKSSNAPDRFGPGWNVGLAFGFQVLLARHFGLLTEIGWLRSQGNFDGGNLIANQGVWRIGFVF